MIIPQKMKAVDVLQNGPPEVLKVINCAVPTPGEQEILIKVHFAGVNKPDALQRLGQYKAPLGANPRLGLEVSGEVIAVGKKTKRWKIGDLVTALVPGGGYAEFVTTNEDHALRIPTGLDMNQAAALCETFFTVWTNVFLRGKLKAGEKFLVHGGSSGIGTTAIQLANVFGAEVYTTAGTNEKCKRCEALGAQYALNYKSNDFVEFFKKKTNNEGVNLILDMVGGAYTAKNISVMANDARLVLIGFLGGHEANVNFTQVMMKRLVITGSTLRPQSDKNKTEIAEDLARNVWPLIESGEIKPVIDSTYKLEEVIEAHKRLESSNHIGKITLKVL
ncbi:MAG: NAD(P)H-quinone oxidoreductase [Paracoccaceae bacterium]|nr:NAD(P)H-quinone oxidoreductase [Paracoccaceae bacterium]